MFAKILIMNDCILGTLFLHIKSLKEKKHNYPIHKNRVPRYRPTVHEMIPKIFGAFLVVVDNSNGECLLKLVKPILRSLYFYYFSYFVLIILF